MVYFGLESLVFQTLFYKLLRIFRERHHVAPSLGHHTCRLDKLRNLKVGSRYNHQCRYLDVDVVNLFVS